MSTKKKVAIAAGVVGAGLAAYGVHKYSSLKKEMNNMNSGINMGRAAVKNLYTSAYPSEATSRTVTYLGNDFKRHQAVRTATSYRNYGVGTQQTFNNVRDYARAKKKYIGRY